MNLKHFSKLFENKKFTWNNRQASRSKRKEIKYLFKNNNGRQGTPNRRYLQKEFMHSSLQKQWSTSSKTSKTNNDNKPGMMGMIANAPIALSCTHLNGRKKNVFNYFRNSIRFAETS